ncbi:hypothetical protein CYMTET_4952 [Cymbomonas tetramitiformis]|uniref:Uncharacterized protein n=1 Tax=Cymbomonas tetramitiformis TaxID=36881 RepID=A0AAE0H0D9_9CHLO|nr:hypothetical protein CYMTET_4952 [Cymbomonas tetramitiformis]
MSHVFGPISRDEVFKLLDLDFEYDLYHYTINELVYAVLSTVLRGMALALYEESAYIHPYDGRCALQRLRFQFEGIIGEPGTHHFWARLRSTIIDETIEPAPQLAVVRTLADKHRRLHSGYRTPTGTWSRTSTPFFGHPRLCPPTSRHYIWGCCASTAPPTTTPSPLSLCVSAEVCPPGGDVENGGRYLAWDGTGMPCVTCFRLWAVTTGHMDETDGVCPYVCAQAFVPGRAPALAPSTPPKPPPMSAWPPSAPPQAHALREIELPPQDAAAQPDAAAMISVRFPAVPPPHHAALSILVGSNPLLVRTIAVSSLLPSPWRSTRTRTLSIAGQPFGTHQFGSRSRLPARSGN